MLIKLVKLSFLIIIFSLNISKIIAGGISLDLGRGKCESLSTKNYNEKLIKFMIRNKEKFPFIDTCNLIFIDKSGKKFFKISGENVKELSDTLTIKAICTNNQNKLVETSLEGLPIEFECTEEQTKGSGKNSYNTFQQNMNISFGIQNNDGKLGYIYPES